MRQSGRGVRAWRHRPGFGAAFAVVAHHGGKRDEFAVVAYHDGKRDEFLLRLGDVLSRLGGLGSL